MREKKRARIAPRPLPSCKRQAESVVQALALNSARVGVDVQLHALASGVHGVSFPAAMFKLQVMHVAVARSLQGRHNLLCRQNGRGIGVARLGRIAAARHLGDDFQRDGVQMQLHLGAALVLANLGFPEAVVKLHVIDDGESQLAQPGACVFSLIPKMHRR